MAIKMYIFTTYDYIAITISTKYMAIIAILGEYIALWGEPNELSIQYRIYIFIQYVDS